MEEGIMDPDLEGHSLKIKKHHFIPTLPLFMIPVNMALKLVGAIIQGKASRSVKVEKEMGYNRRNNQGDHTVTETINNLQQRLEPPSLCAAPVGPTESQRLYRSPPACDKCKLAHVGACAKLCARWSKRGS
ncbi:hypothetical protein Tco_0831125 [Tanacetum coccineum]